MNTEPGFVAETLRWCNEQRKAQGKRPLRKLPKGKRKDPMSCPCGKATGLSVNNYDAYPMLPSGRPSQSYKKRIVLPSAVKEFVREFDFGQLPQYEERS